MRKTKIAMVTRETAMATRVTARKTRVTATKKRVIMRKMTRRRGHHLKMRPSLRSKHLKKDRGESLVMIIHT